MAKHTEVVAQSPAVDNNLPVNFGLLVYPGFTPLDLYGPLQVIQGIGWTKNINISIIAATLDPVSTQFGTAANSPTLSNYGALLVPTHTFDNAPDLDVLLVPGGPPPAINAPGVANAVEFIQTKYPSVDYLLTVCTGSGIAARSGVLDGKRATTNKQLWKIVTDSGPKTTWIAKARWVQDGNIWTSSGISAGTDMTFAFVAALYGNQTATDISITMEYDRHLDANWDPYSALHNVTDDVPELSCN